VDCIVRTLAVTSPRLTLSTCGVHDLKKAIKNEIPNQVDGSPLRLFRKVGPDHIVVRLPESELADGRFSAGWLPDNVLHIVVVPPKVVRSIYMCVYSIDAVVSLNAWVQNL
jgi:hypothetical protein